MATVAAALDATAQVVEVNLGFENKFSINEVIETAVTVGANEFEGVTKLAENATKTIAMKATLRAAGESVVVSQLGEMAIGTRPNFDFRQVVAAVSSAYASAYIDVPHADKIPGQTISNGINIASGAAINTLLYHQDPNFEQLAAQAIGAEIVTVGADVVSRYQTNSGQAQHQQRNQPPMPAEFYADYEDPNLVSINANNSRWDRDLTNIASQQRQVNVSTTPQGKTNASTVSYFANPNNQSRFRSTIFGGSSSSSAQSIRVPQVNSLPQQQSSTARVLSQISVPGGDEFIQSLNATSSSQHTLWGEVKSFVGREIDFNSKLRQLELMAVKEEVNSVASDFNTVIHGHGWLRARAAGDIAFDAAALLYPSARGLNRMTIGFFGRRVAVAGESSIVSINNLYSPEEQLNKALQQSNIYNQLENIYAADSNAANALANKLSRLMRAQASADKTVTTPDGLVRYYDKFRPAKSEGSTIGSRFVTEYNSQNGNIMMLNESYDVLGNVNRINLKNINGIKINSQHFPPTLRELNEAEFISMVYQP